MMQLHTSLATVHKPCRRAMYESSSHESADHTHLGLMYIKPGDPSVLY